MALGLPAPRRPAVLLVHNCAADARKSARDREGAASEAGWAAFGERGDALGVLGGAHRFVEEPVGVVDRAGLATSIAARLGPWRRVADVHASVARAEFASPEEGDTWGAADVVLHVVGEDSAGAGRRSTWACACGWS